MSLSVLLGLMIGALFVGPMLLLRWLPARRGSAAAGRRAASMPSKVVPR